jgi:hypothetical protein
VESRLGVAEEGLTVAVAAAGAAEVADRIPAIVELFFESLVMLVDVVAGAEVDVEAARANASDAGGAGSDTRTG